MLDFELQRCTRRCATTDREFRPGEPFFSVLVRDGTQVIRRDYSVEAWGQPPLDAIAWWKSQMPGGSGKRALWAPHDVMLDYLVRLEGEEGKADVRYVLALLMIRRRILRLEHTETGATEDETLVLYCPRNETEYRIRCAMPLDARTAEIQAELSQLLVTPAA